VLVAAEALSRAAVVRFWQELPAARLTGLAHETGPPDSPASVTALLVGAAIAIVLVWPAMGFGAARHYSCRPRDLYLRQAVAPQWRTDQ
jgi:hypothetical protein